MAASAVVAFALLHINTNIQFPQAGSTQIRYYIILLHLNFMA